MVMFFFEYDMDRERKIYGLRDEVFLRRVIFFFNQYSQHNTRDKIYNNTIVRILFSFNYHPSKRYLRAKVIEHSLRIIDIYFSLGVKGSNFHTLVCCIEKKYI